MIQENKGRKISIQKEEKSKQEPETNTHQKIKITKSPIPHTKKEIWFAS